MPYDFESTRTELVNITQNADTEVSPTKDRISVYIRNVSSGAQVVILTFGLRATRQGIYLNPGDSVVDSNTAGYVCWQGPILGFSSSAGAQVSIYER